MVYKLFLFEDSFLCEVLSKRELEVGSAFVLDSHICKVVKKDEDKCFLEVIADNLISVEVLEGTK